MQLNTTLSPISRDERNKINENWQRIIAECSRLQAQINILSGDVNVEDILQALEDAIAHANDTVAALEQQVQQSIADNDNATQQAIDNLNSQLQTSLDTISTKLTELETAITNAETATTNANTATSEAQSATTNALSAITDMRNFVSELGFIGVYDSTATYDKNNMVRYQKAVYIALVDGLAGITPSDDGVNWRLVIRDGVDGTGAVSTVNGVSPNENGDVHLTPISIGAASSTDLNNLKTEVNEHLAESKMLVTIYNTVNQSIPNNTITELLFDTLEVTNNADFCDLVSGKIRFKKDGVYEIKLICSWSDSTANGYRRVYVASNYTSSTSAGSGSGSAHNQQITINRNQSINSELLVRVLQTSGQAIEVHGGSNNTILSIRKVG